MTSPTQTPAPARRRAKFHALTVASVRPLTENSVEVTFDVPEELREDYNYLPGQYVALRRDFDGQEVRRSYSICDVSDPGTISVGIKKDLGGLFSTWANEELAPGMTIEVMNPQGAFTSKVHVTSMNNPEALVDAESARTAKPHIVSFAAGSGITPVMAISKAFLERTNDADVELVYSNKGQNDVMFAEEIGDLKDKYPTRLAAHHILTRENRPNPLYSGRLDQEKLDLLLDRVIDVERVDEWFLCGPFEFVQMIRDTLAARGVAAEKVRFELFTTGDPADGPSPARGRQIQIDSNEKTYTINFHLDGTDSTSESPVSANETILNAALRSRPDVPYACAGGVCGTCRAKVITGEVEMDENYALEPEEVEAGYVLTCQTRPTTDTLTVDYDA
ncbi:1,2-phenylacetyl-CoA epoxidase subunit PaaE [Corynebacterium guangdongense]|uniref:Ring-1,2-phenylacetyl-CoA epoxidase subunit PaaE n=1 Tax=Corynebacterium guangdongense TaxID=1783348 RepID=A0ABU1ZYB1_9CORY|nr:1,2-phenylacetyl-CoA epoxidase subunit PaaE [Corynebacterium guangdongense]MDR7329924.1 ring-1,2-phenylacetyl-CoA epoxidase subunit PaaE [Corynebacterium guangdongense]WJZ18482.1 1,2-phenylacetyl-CoA epoxidase, subunit E [Corynebacterium guangdongense]